MMDDDQLDMGQLVCYKTNQFIAFNKPSGLSVQSKEKPDFHQRASGYAKRKLFVLHRIDQPTSGAILFARNSKAAAVVSKQFRTGAVSRIYYAAVKNEPAEKEGLLRHYLVKNAKLNKSYVVEKGIPQSKLAEMTYKVICKSDTYHLLRIVLNTGRHHQIRVQLGHIGSPIKGDVKYGDRRSNRDRSIHLHAATLTFLHPVSNAHVEITAPFPNDSLWNFFKAQLTEKGPDV